MKTFIKTVLGFCCIISLCLSPACTPIIEEEVTTGSISGIVSDKTTGEPIPTVRLTLEPAGASTVTGSDGSFSFKKIEKGTYTVKYIKDGYKDGEYEVSVKAGLNTEAQLLIERIPAVVTADRDLLDFGENESTNTLSFNIVNPGYVDLEWEIEERCDWITEVKPLKGVLKYGKTEAIVVVIDREVLSSGSNEAVIVVRSSNGSSNVKVTAVGQERYLPSSNTLDASDITSASAIINGEIIDSGVPAYTERGFVYSLNPMPSFDNMIAKLTAPVTDDAKYSYLLKGLALGEQYFVRAYATNSIGTSYSTNEISFITVASSPELKVADVSNIDVPNSSVTFNGTVLNSGDPKYIERGFVYGKESSPTVDKTKVKVYGTDVGTFSTNVSGLLLNQRYYVRSYAISKINDSENVVYSNNEVSFEITTTAPEVSVQEVSNIDVNSSSATLNGSVISCGAPMYIEKGFVYATNNNPTVVDTKVEVYGADEGAFHVKVSGFALNQLYYVRAYAISQINDSKQIVYSEKEMSFEIIPVEPNVQTLPVSQIDIANSTAMFNGIINSLGEPGYTEKGFVYSTLINPTVNDTKLSVYGNAIGEYSCKVKEIKEGDEYFVRAYAIQMGNVIYGDNQRFNYVALPPVVNTYDVSNIIIGENTVKFNGCISSLGDLINIERGFVYSKYHNPSLTDNKVVAFGTGIGEFSSVISNVEEGHVYYVRAYATNSKQTVYGPERSFDFFAISPEVETLYPINVSSSSIALYGRLVFEGDPVLSDKGFICSTMPNPSLDDNSVMNYPVSGTAVGDYSVNVSNLIPNQKYYIRAYARNEKCTAYGEIKVITVEEPKYKFVGNNLLVQNEDVSDVDINWSSSKSVCDNSIVGGFDDWRLPTNEEAAILFENQEEIGGFMKDQESIEYVDGSVTNIGGINYYTSYFNTVYKHYYYWTCSFPYYSTINMTTAEIMKYSNANDSFYQYYMGSYGPNKGSSSNYKRYYRDVKTYNFRARCVRTLTE